MMKILWLRLLVVVHLAGEVSVPPLLGAVCQEDWVGQQNRRQHGHAPDDAEDHAGGHLLRLVLRENQLPLGQVGRQYQRIHGAADGCRGEGSGGVRAHVGEVACGRSVHSGVRVRPPPRLVRAPVPPEARVQRPRPVRLFAHLHAEAAQRLVRGTRVEASRVVATQLVLAHLPARGRPHVFVQQGCGFQSDGLWGVVGAPVAHN
mmetsp:Transcript_21072/g.46211  ORF Transcript_21072/g.46211 Transcript_21072/m.46211 type:complete len:204 (+) Transcript_21072:224-835(+)